MTNPRDRRRYPRHAAWFPVEIDRGDGVGHLGACVDGSASGMLLRSRDTFRVGERVHLVFLVLPGQREWIHVEAEVVRSDLEVPLDGEIAPWPVWLAVRLCVPIPKLEMFFQVIDAKRSPYRPRLRKRAPRPVDRAILRRMSQAK